MNLPDVGASTISCDDRPLDVTSSYMPIRPLQLVVPLAFLTLACDAASEEPTVPTGGTAGENGGSSGSPGRGVGSGGSGGGSAGAGGASGEIPDAGDPGRDAGARATDVGAADGSPAANPPASNQGPTAPGNIVYSNDFETDRNGISLSPAGLPEDRVQIVDDPQKQRGKVLRVEWRAGDNFRTSGGTQPRNWISNREGHEFEPGTRVSHAFGFMMGSSDTDYAFAQVISSGGPVWMLIVEGSGTLTVFCNACGGNSRHMTLAPNRWYDFRVDTDFASGGPVAFHVNGEMFRMGRMNGTRGTIAHWDGGIYNRPSGTSKNRTRNVYISNLSVGQR
jgi:hypothetical protein